VPGRSPRPAKTEDVGKVHVRMVGEKQPERMRGNPSNRKYGFPASPDRSTPVLSSLADAGET